jgi:hypothetical protein
MGDDLVTTAARGQRFRYYVTTRDNDRERFMPEKGVRCGPYSLFGIRKALRRLRRIGYRADRNDGLVLVVRMEYGESRPPCVR